VITETILDWAPSELFLETPCKTNGVQADTNREDIKATPTATHADFLQIINLSIFISYFFK